MIFVITFFSLCASISANTIEELQAQVQALQAKVDELTISQTANRRKLATVSVPSLDGYSGLRVKRDKAFVELGTNGAVRLIRTGSNEALIQAGTVSTTGSIKVAGDIAVGNSGKACTSANAGSLRWANNEMNFCDGKAWQKLRVLKGEWTSLAGTLFSTLEKFGKGEAFARDDVTYCSSCLGPSAMKTSSDFRISSSGDAPFMFKGSCNSACEISGDSSGNIKLSGSNGNDAIRMKSALLKGDFEYGCTVTAGTSSHNRFGMGLWSTKAIGQFHSGNSAGNCGSISGGGCYFCRFEQTSCSYAGSYSSVFSISGIHDLNAKFKFVRKSGQVCAYVNDQKKGCYSQKETGDMYGAVQNDGGSSRNLKNCYYKSLSTGTKGNYQFTTLSALNADGTPIKDFQIISGSLPKGMSLDKTSGMITGKPAEVQKATNYNFVVKASGKNDPVMRSFQIQVRHKMNMEQISTDFSQGSNKPFTYKGSCNSKCEIASDSNGNVRLDGSNGNDAIIMNKPLLVGDFEYGCTVTSGSSSHNRFGMGVWDETSYSQFSSGNSAGYCAQASKGNCFFCRFEQTSCSQRGSYSSLFSLSGIHDLNARFMFKRIGTQICAYINGNKKGCLPGSHSGPMYGAIQNDGGSSRNMHKCYYKTINTKSTYV